VVAMHSTEADNPPENFHFRYIMGLRRSPGVNQNVNPHALYSVRAGVQADPELVPVVADIQDLSGQPKQAGSGSPQ